MPVSVLRSVHKITTTMYLTKICTKIGKDNAFDQHKINKNVSIQNTK